MTLQNILNDNAKSFCMLADPRGNFLTNIGRLSLVSLSIKDIIIQL